MGETIIKMGRERVLIRISYCERGVRFLIIMYVLTMSSFVCASNCLLQCSDKAFIGVFFMKDKLDYGFKTF